MFSIALHEGGYFYLSVPFLVRLHPHPTDCTRWSEEGLLNFLVECGFSPGNITTGAWGNKACVIANLDEWVEYCPDKHSLNYEHGFECVVWALARK